MLGQYLDPDPQLVAEAIAAFSQTNLIRRGRALPPLESKTFAGITMVGTTPNFFRIPVTQQLIVALATAQYPAEPTIVHKLVPPVPDHTTILEQGMLPLANRRIILQCFEAFKQFVVRLIPLSQRYCFLTQPSTPSTELIANICNYCLIIPVCLYTTCFLMPMTWSSPELD